MSSETSSITSPPSPDRNSAPASCPLPPKIIEPTSTHTATVIFLHGLGDKATGWPSQAIRDNKLAEELPYVRWVIPNAPEKKMTAPGYKGAKVRRWHDFRTRTIDDYADLEDMEHKEDEEGMRWSVDYINALILSEAKTCNRIVLAGFSQGSAMTLLTTVMSRPVDEGGIGKLAGFIAMSGYLPLASSAAQIISPLNPNLSTPFLMLHGTIDPTVKIYLGRESRRRMEDLGFVPEWKEYGAVHQITMEMGRDVLGFLERVVPGL